MKKIFILWAALMPLFLYANTPIPNQQQYPTGTATYVANTKYNPLLMPGGISSSNRLIGASGSPTLNDIATWANNSIQQQAIGAPNGVASLDVNGRVTSPISTTSLTGLGGNYGYFMGIKTPYGVEQPSPHLSVMRGHDDNGNTWDAPGDYIGGGIDWSSVWMLGGHRADDSGMQWTFGWPDSGGLGAVVDGVWMNGRSAGQGSGVTAGGWSSMAGNDTPSSYNGGYMNFDAAARSTITGSIPPKFIVSSQINDPEGNSHSITFNSTGAVFSPALPIEWSRQIHPGMNLMTNVIAVSHAPGNPWNNPSLGDSYFRKAFNMYAGTVSSFHTTSAGQVDSVTLDTGWYVMQQTQITGHSEGGAVPMQNTLDGSPVALDTYFTNWTRPVIEFGVSTKAFPSYAACALQPQSSNPDINNPKGNIGSLVHECDNEWDFWSTEPRDYLSSMHGLTLVFTANGKLTLDSYGIGIAGQGALPLGQRIWNLLDGSVSYQAMGNGNIVQHNIYQPEVIGTTQGAEYTAQAWQFASGPGNNNPLTSSLRITQYRDSSTLNQSGTSIHIGYKYDGVTDPQSTQNASAGGQIIYNPVGYQYGIGLCSGGTFQNPICSVISDVSGNLWLTNGASVLNGQGIGFVPTTGDSNGHPFISGSSPSTLDFKTSAGGYANTNLYGINTNGGSVNISSGQGLGLIPQSGDSSGHGYFYGYDNYHIILSDTAGGEAALRLGDLKVDGSETVNGNITVNNLAGTGNAYACINSSGQIYRSQTACN